MSDSDSSNTPLPKRDEETSPFPLERGKSIPPPPSESDLGSALPKTRAESETTGERTGPFLLERERSAPDHPIVEAPPPLRLTKSARVSRRRIAITLLVHTLLLATLATVSIVRWTEGKASPPELALAVLSGGIALVHLRAGFRFARLGRRESHDGHLLVGAFSDLRTVIVLKAISLFLALTLLCFSLSMLISLVVSI